MASSRRIPPAVRILLVEDSRALQDALTAIFRSLDWVHLVGVADTAAEAIRCFEKTPSDLVILDLVLREGSGFEVLRRIKASQPTCRVLIFTSHDSEPFRVRCRQAGADGFYSKSRQHRDLIQELHSYHRSTQAAKGTYPRRG